MIYLVRHGQTDWNAQGRLQGQTDIPLNGIGLGQAQVAAAEVADLEIDKIYSSDLLRALQTAQIIAEGKGLQVTQDSRLREFSFGNAEGRIVPELTEEEKRVFNQDPHAFNAETPRDVFDRVKSFLDEMSDGNNLIVSHSGTTRMIMYCMRHKDFDAIEYELNYDWHRFDIGNAQVIKIPLHGNKI
ncbi:MAG: histidine phosphatase family protein [Firmicutes bacterium]|nr:histidine phosphatase family protein [Bacillota bacterium]